MFDEMGDQIDGVVIATPDHTHAVITMAAMERGKHVYVQKPLTWSVAEARALRDAAERTGVVTQMGNQGHSSNDARLVNEYIRDGAIGTVEEIHIWTNRPIWPQGIPMPEEVHRVPQTLDWDLYLGPAPETGFHEAFHPFRWRGWVDYGTGALGDMGAHLVDHPFWALELGYPTTVETRSTSFNEASWPNASMTFYEFPARTVENMGERPAVRMTWYDGGLRPPRPNELAEDEDLNPGGGVLYVGTEGKLLHDTYGGNPRLLPVQRMEEYPTPPELFPRVEGENHEMNWARAIRGEEEAVSPFSYAAPLTEVMLLGIVSLRAGHQKIEYDAENMEVTNLPEANQYLRRQNPRAGWSLEEVTVSVQGQTTGGN
jgi:predicted dehydrogenase